ncbi:MAG: nucleotidyl transferase AbiEii/AbiGii toxin family protein, partial [Bifidobacteriaceae bacterium]|nr:nucleotidyl transferase AbiEii/AbiGii toxin family protein [Bifidobacteriaceae bacterium]
MPSGAVESLNQQIRNLASAQGVPAIRLRNRLAFERVLARLAQDPAWVLKGGFNLELRLGLAARSTRDLDVLRLGMIHMTAQSLHEVLVASLSADAGDGFTFSVRPPRSLRLHEEPSSWRTTVDVYYSGSSFGTLALDVVTRDAGSAADSDLLVVRPLLGSPEFMIAATNVVRQVAEKLHAMARVYAHDRPSSRMKDLVDVVLLEESGLLDAGQLGAALRAVFSERDRTSPPDRLPDMPLNWVESYAPLAASTGTAIADAREAWRLASALYADALASE